MEEWLTIEELADELRIPVATIYQWRYKKMGPRGARFGRHVRYRRSDIDAWTATHLD